MKGKTCAGWGVAALLVWGGAACAYHRPQEQQPGPQLEVGELGDLATFAVCGELWLGRHVSAKDLELAARRGVTRVIDLSDDGVQAGPGYAGPKLIGLPFDAETAADAEVDAVLRLLDAPESGTTFLIDDFGGELGVVLAIWRAAGEGVDLELALVEGRRVGMKPGEQEQLVRAQVMRLSGH